ncbi:altronate oxidoreductase [Cohnella sp. CIP 111063]|uniref:tagaturonate reductase n=1 Tax=unclassified Cohnella TaxID=2636738 RepID=UPI000B8C24D3|nr:MULTISPECIES: tagaturonate reductase [unclassified Cohnella]OXS59900.1 altronate oxidoreductase [Cohnella sp. CIP 111063]PRX72702.1 tagaturonate reductase [Cohnella sp. SGD-V74]
MNKLNRQQLQIAGAASGQSPYKHDADAANDPNQNDAPVTVLQIGEGNFLRGFFDWMVHESRKQGLFRGGVAVTQPRPSGKPKIDALNGQDRLYTLVIRGLDNGEPVERREIVSVFAEAFDPYGEWERMIGLAVSPDLRFVVSNTTEAGIVYRPEALTEGEPIVSFPGKIAYLLYRRYLAFDGAADRGLLFLPCELLERNGDALQESVLKYAADWGLPEAFREWVTTANRFLNSLVDRIVAGYPDQEQAEAWFTEWGYRDDLLCVAEPYHLWAIEGEPELDELLPFASAGLNVVWTDSLEPYRERKVRILNGAHTLMTPLGILSGVEHVRELMEHETLGAFVKSTVRDEIIPSLPYPQEEMEAYANEVFDRYLNPFVRHRLYDIAMNSVSKFKVRLLPSLEHYARKGERIPDGLAKGLAALLRYYRVKKEGTEYRGTAFDGRSYAVRDDAEALETLAAAWGEAERTGESPEETARRLLASEKLWGQDLSQWPGLAAQVAQAWAEWTEEERT